MSNKDGYTRPEPLERPHHRLYCMYRGPGPAYQLKGLLGTNDHCVTKQQAPAYSIGNPYKWKTTEHPGPSYKYSANLTHQGIQQPPKFRFTGRPLVKGPEILPGPGAYDSHAVTRPLPRITMGQRARTLTNDVPPPNAYNVQTGIGSGSTAEKSSPSYSIRSRRSVGSTYYSAFKAAVPGPSEYGTPGEALASVRECSIKARYPVKEYNTARDNPGPGTYEAKASGCCFGSQKRGFYMGVRHSEYQMPFIARHDNDM